MAVGVLIEVFGKMVFSFTRSVMEHYNPEEPAFTIESFGFNPLKNTQGENGTTLQSASLFTKNTAMKRAEARTISQEEL